MTHSPPAAPDPGNAAAGPGTGIGHETIEHREPPVHHWRAAQLRRLGIPATLAEAYADRLDWRQVARLMQRGCPARLALLIVC
jgi:hypothetical protein